MNSYQRRKARMIAAVLIAAAAAADIPFAQLPELAAKMSHREWTTVSMSAGVPVADRPAKLLTVAYLIQARGR